MGRHTGSQNKGYFYRSGRGWYSQIGKRMIPLLDEDDNHLRDKATSVKVLKAAHRRIIAELGEPVNATPETESAAETQLETVRKRRI
jgi:hypothetical protein